ncbi:MAG: zinc ribbon domain-containing protein, partial [Dehalococcoidia bacterium]|nr:zinc ribbon domain-containing protein [Dehalococcoidia bacterium]
KAFLVGSVLNGRDKYYRGRNAIKRAYTPDRCKMHYIRDSVLKELVWGKIKELLSQPEVIIAEFKRQMEALSQGRRSTDIDTEIRKLGAKLSRLNRGITNLMEFLEYARDKVDDEFKAEIIDRVAKRRIKRETLLAQKRELEEARKKMEAAASGEIFLDEFAARIKHNLGNATFEDKRLALKALGVKVYADDREIDIETT